MNIPFELRAAVRADHISFRLFHKEDFLPVKYERVSTSSGDPVPWSEIVKGYEYEKGKYVVMTDEDFKAAALESSKTIDILDFVKEEEIDTAHEIAERIFQSQIGSDSHHRVDRRRRQEDARASAKTGLGRNHRKAHRFDLRSKQSPYSSAITIAIGLSTSVTPVEGSRAPDLVRCTTSAHATTRKLTTSDERA